MTKLGISVLCVALAAGTLATPVAAQDLGIEVGKRAPSAVVTTLDGKPVDIGAYIGKVPVFLEFWATWCPRCHQLEPSLLAAGSATASASGAPFDASSASSSLRMIDRATRYRRWL